MRGKETNHQEKDIAVMGVVEIIGEDALDAFLGKVADTPQDLTVRGILRRAGRAGFYYWLKQQLTRRWFGADFRFAPVKKKISSGFADICTSFEAEHGALVKLDNQANAWQFVLDNRLAGQAAPALTCDYIAGFLQEFASWAGLGKAYQVCEETCVLRGDPACRIVILKNPLD